MEKVEFCYGCCRQCVEIGEENLIASLLPRKIESHGDAKEKIQKALDAPIESKKVEEIIKPGEKIAIIISDVTRPCPSYKILPPLVERLEKAGCRREDMTIVSGLGSHRPQTEEEWAKLVGPDIYGTIKIEDSYGDDFILIGASSRKTPYEVYGTVVRADRRICIGNIDYHYFAGYSGGAKAIVPGVCSRGTIQANHSMMLDEAAKVGFVDGNPVREDMEEIVKFLPIDFIINVVLDEKKEIISAVAGHAYHAHRAGCRVLDAAYKMPIEELADIVIASPGGLPKDLNVYQTQKALDNAQWAVKPGGIIILVGECKEGYGEHVFEEWLEAAENPENLLARIRQEFRLGGHKAAAIAAIVQKYQVYLVSCLPVEMVQKLYMKPFTDLQVAYEAAMAEKGPQARVYCMTVGGTTLPNLKK